MNDAEIAAGLAPTPGYRYAETVGHQLLVAGQVPNDTSGAIVHVGSAREQAKACLDNLRLVVESNGFDVGDIRQVTVYATGEHGDLLAAFGGTVEWFGGETPPATLLGVQMLGYPDQMVEIDATVIADPA